METNQRNATVVEEIRKVHQYMMQEIWLVANEQRVMYLKRCQKILEDYNVAR